MPKCCSSFHHFPHVHHDLHASRSSAGIMKQVISTMSTDKDTLPSRRQVLQATGGLAAAAMVTGFRFPDVHPGGSDMIQVALVGCGGRGGGAAENAVSTTSGPIKLVAMADVFQDRMD